MILSAEKHETKVQKEKKEWFSCELNTIHPEPLELSLRVARLPS
jgi:hypothetical protein